MAGKAIPKHTIGMWTRERERLHAPGLEGVGRRVAPEGAGDLVDRGGEDTQVGHGRAGYPHGATIRPPLSCP